MYGDEIVYIVDDDEFLQMRLELLLEAYDIKVEGFSNANAFLKRWHPQMSGCLVLDQVLPDMSGLDLSDVLLKRGLALPIILMSAHTDTDMIMAAVDREVYRFIPKPFDDHKLIDAIVAAIGHNRSAHTFRRRQLWHHRMASLSGSERKILDEASSGNYGQIFSPAAETDEATPSFRKALSKMELSSLDELTMAVDQLSDRGFPNPVAPCPDIWDGDLDFHLDMELVLDESS